MKNRVAVLVMFVLCSCLAPVFAQAPAKPAPVVAAPATPVMVKLDSVTLENHLLKVDRAKAQLDKAQADLQQFLATLQKPGFVIQQDQTGAFMYVSAQEKK